MTNGDFADKVAMVTGAGSGLGEAMARGLGRAGATVVIADIDAESATRVAADLASEGIRATGHGMDVADATAARSVVDDVVEGYGSLDIVVNNAGVRYITPFLEQTAEEWRKTIDVNLTGTFICAQAAARHMVPRGWGRIINIASVTGILALTKRSSYAASKAGVIGLTKALAFELSHTGVTSNAIAPGPIETALNAPYFEDEVMVATLKKEIPRGTWGQPEDLVGAVNFLASDAAGYVSGAVLAVSGGWLSGKGY